MWLSSMATCVGKDWAASELTVVSSMRDLSNMLRSSETAELEVQKSGRGRTPLRDIVENSCVFFLV